ncbi:hypothetical protein ACX80O_00450 [Arthrobacter sp. Hz1]
MPVDARVARILTEKTIALNVGSTDSVSVGDVVVISERITVTDPITHEDLGEVDVERLNGEVVSVKPRISVVKVTSTYTSSGTRFLKSITEDPDLEDYRTVHIRPSDYAEVSKKPVDPWSSEPPF